MADKRIVKGLLDVVDAEAGEAWELDPDTIVGMGLGASPDAVRWARLGRHFELIQGTRSIRIEPKKRDRGQPKKAVAMTNDVLRALVLYLTFCALRKSQGVSDNAKIKIGLFALIDLATGSFPTNGLFDKPTAKNKMHESVKRGRMICEIDEFWRGKPSQEIVESLFNPV
jgi:hypothetical protein